MTFHRALSQQCGRISYFSK